MKKFRTEATIELHSGVIGLSDRQAALRGLQLKEAGRGTYEITGPVQFKAGEVIGLKEVPKPYAGVLEEVLSLREVTIDEIRNG